MIIRGGYNVYPREVEEVLYEHLAVAEAAVVGIPHDELGEEIGAAVKLKPGETVTAEELDRFCQRPDSAVQVSAAYLDGARPAQGPDRQDFAPRGAGTTGRPMTAATEQIINVDGQDLRVAVRYGQAGATPLLIINGIGASLELLQPFVDALDPDKSGDVIRFDVPGVGGSPCPAARTASAGCAG